MTPQRVTLITLGTADLAASRAFYGRLGWKEHGASQGGVAFFQINGAVLGLFPLDDLAKDQGRPGARLGTGATTLAQNFATEAEVDRAYAAALAAGGTAMKRPLLRLLGRPRRPCLGGGDEPFLAAEFRRKPDTSGLIRPPLSPTTPLLALPFGAECHCCPP